MTRKWLYPYCVIAPLALILFFSGCDSQSSTSFSVDVQVENEEGRPIEGAQVRVRPCYEVESEVWCGEREDRPSMTSALTARSVELSRWEVERVEAGALLRWTTESENENAGFRLEWRSEEGTDTFSEIAFVDGQGTTSDSTTYTYQYEALALGVENTFRLVAVALDGTRSVVGEPETIQGPSFDPEIEPIFPNPFRSQTQLRVQVGDSASLRSTAHALDGSKVQTIVDDASLQPGRHARIWSADDLPVGLYEHRTSIREAGEVVVRDTIYAVIMGATSEAPSLGSTDADGAVSTRARFRFPVLYDVPTIEVRDGEGRSVGTIEVSPTVEFIVTTENGRQTFRRTVSEGENTLTLSVSP